MSQQSLEQNLDILIRTPDKTIFSGKAIAISTLNAKGPLDILPYHANLISLINTTLVIHETKENKKEIKIDNGVIKVSKNYVEIYIGL